MHVCGDFKQLPDLCQAEGRGACFSSFSPLPSRVFDLDPVQLCE
jgi:hypothetical protein